MADPSRAGEAQPEVVRRHTAPADRLAELFDQLRQRAEDLARTAEFSATVHAKMPAHLLHPPDHAERDRLLAAAERAAAEAYRAHRVPSEEIRAAIRRAGQTGGAL